MAPSIRAPTGAASQAVAPWLREKTGGVLGRSVKRPESWQSAQLISVLVGPRVYLAAQTLESCLVTPLVQREKVSLPPLLVICAQLGSEPSTG